MVKSRRVDLLRRRLEGSRRGSRRRLLQALGGVLRAPFWLSPRNQGLPFLLHSMAARRNSRRSRRSRRPSLRRNRKLSLVSRGISQGRVHTLLPPGDSAGFGTLLFSRLLLKVDLVNSSAQWKHGYVSLSADVTTGRARAYSLAPGLALRLTFTLRSSQLASTWTHPGLAPELTLNTSGDTDLVWLTKSYWTLLARWTA